MLKIGSISSSDGRKPDTPTIGTATAGDAQATITFTAPSYLGKPSSSLTYTVVSSPSSIQNTGSSSPITVTGLSNGTSYTFRVKLNNTVLDSELSSSSNSVTPVATPVFGFTPGPPFGFSPQPPVFSFGGAWFGPGGGGGGYGFSAPWSNSISLQTKIRTPNGLKLAGEIQVGDSVYSLNIPSGLDEQEWLSWSSDPDNFTANIVETTVTSVLTASGSTYVYVDGDMFTPTHYILTKKDDVIKFIKVDELDNTYQRYSYEINDFVDIEIVEDITVDQNNVSIHCEPHDNFFTEQMLVLESLPH
jgi:hypothetical protein